MGIDQLTSQLKITGDAFVIDQGAHGTAASVGVKRGRVGPVPSMTDQAGRLWSTPKFSMPVLRVDGAAAQGAGFSTTTRQAVTASGCAAQRTDRQALRR